MQNTWIEHRREEDRELLGWIEPEGEHFRVFNLLGREILYTDDWFTAEEALNRAGISYLSEKYLLLVGGARKQVVLVSVSPSGITAKTDDYGDITASQEFFELPFPAPDTLQLKR